MRFLLIISLFFLIACNNKEPDPFKNNLGVSEKYVAAIDTAHFTTIDWKNILINAGNINEGDTVYANFTFKNSGKNPLFILAVHASCGCTIINFPNDKILPGKIEEIKTKFNTLHTYGFTRKTILVTTNTSNHNKTLLAIEANVVAHKSTN